LVKHDQELYILLNQEKQFLVILFLVDCTDHIFSYKYIAVVQILQNQELS